jgi:hypothetical protein
MYIYNEILQIYCCSRKDPHFPHTQNFCHPEEEKKLFLIIVSVLGHPKGLGGLTSNFLCGGGVDVFWNDPLRCSYTRTRFRTMDDCLTMHVMQPGSEIYIFSQYPNGIPGFKI